jgi:hypothetical protein
LLIGTQKPEELAKALNQKITMSSPSDNNVKNDDNKEEIDKSQEVNNSDK